MKSAKRGDLTRLRESGRAARRGPLLVRYAPGGDELLCAYAISAKGTTAVARNRVRRQLREAVRALEREQGLQGVVLVSVDAAQEHTYQELEQALRAALRKVAR